MMELDKNELARCEGFVNSRKHLFPWAADEALVHINTTPCPGSPGTPAWCINAVGTVQLDLTAIYANETGSKIERVVGNVSYSGTIPNLWLGFLAHEFAHSRWSTWKHLPAKPAVAQVVELFEEIRIETNAANMGGSSYLRHSFKWLLQRLTENEISTVPRALAHTWALIYGRYVAGIARHDEIEVIDSAIRTALTDDTVDILREILEESITVHSSKIERVYELAEEWLDLLKSDEDEEDGSGAATVTLILHAGGDGDDEKSDSDEAAPAGSASGSDDDEDESAETGGGVDDSDDEHEEELKEVLIAALIEVAEDLNPDAPLEVALTRDVLATANTVFSKRKPGEYTWTERTPTGALRAEAAKLARTLEAVSLPSVTLTHRPSVLPPGRLRGREAVRQAAERSQGLMSTATPWRTTKRERTRTKPVVVATMTDTSGSMSWATDFVADFAWMMSTAGARVGARSAAVTFGDRAEAVVAPGKIPQNVRVRRADGGTEAFDEAAAAIEGMLHLGVNSNAAKIVFIISDGELVMHGEIERAALWVEKWTQAGALVVWIGARPGYWSRISKKARKPGHAINLQYGNDTRKIMAAMEGEVVKAARGMNL